MNLQFYVYSDNQKLNEENAKWVAEATDKVYRLLEDTPPEGSSFAKAIRHILKVEKAFLFELQ